MIYEMCRNFANEELAPNAGEWDQKHAFPTEAITHMVRNGTIFNEVRADGHNHLFM